MEFVVIAAVGKNLELGKDNDLIWNLSKDLRFFSQQTKGSSIVMGRKTFESLPKMLPGRHHIVISRSVPSLPSEVEVFDSMESFLTAYQDKDETVYCIGGAQIYTQMLPFADKLILTEIDEVFDADVYFPSFDHSQYNRTVLGTDQENGLTFQWVQYVKK